VSVPIAKWVQTLSPDDLPPAPFRLNHYTTVVDVPKWLGKLQEDVNIETGRPRNHKGALRRDLLSLKQIIEELNQW